MANGEGDALRAARLLGAVARMMDEGGSTTPPFVLAYFGDPEATAGAVLGAEAYELAHAEGYAMTLNQARAYAIQCPSSTPRV
jgi:hypothetical protein